MTTAQADTRLRTACLRLWSAQRRHDAYHALPRPHTRGQTVRKSRIGAIAADDLRRAEADYEAARKAVEG